jgi:hypothetical protein
MKLTSKSKQFLSFFTNNKYIHHIKNTSTTNNILLKLYHDILNAYKYLQSIKKTTKLYHYDIVKIQNSLEITKPKNFNYHSFPQVIREHIDELSLSEISYDFSLFNRKIKVVFVVEDPNIELKIHLYNKYVDSIIMWLYVLNLYSSKQCANSLIIYFYFTSLEKKLPDSNIHVLDERHINTAFTTTCPKDSEIVIFRREEWFKVFIHETFHNFGLDFSDMNNNDCHKYLLGIFKVQSFVNSYEAYTEFWAETINVIFCSFYSLKEKERENDSIKNQKEFLSNAEFFINFERSYSFFQLVKILDFMGLTYKDLYLNNPESKILRENLYKEKTNILAYYVIKTVMMNNYPSFLLWCDKNNFSLIAFKKSIANQNKFCEFIGKNYKNPSMLENIDNSELFLEQLKKNKKNKNNKNNKTKDILLTNLRMSICELS